MNDLRVESHVTQKSRRQKLRFQQNSSDPNQQHDPHFEHFRPKYGSISYDPNVFPSEMLNSVARNPHLLLPPSHVFVSHDQDPGSGSSPQPERPTISNHNTLASGSFVNFHSPVSCKVINDPQNSSNWKGGVGSHSHHQVSSDWNVVAYSNAASMSIDHSNNSNSPMLVGEGSSRPSCYGYNQDVPNVSLRDQKHYLDGSAFGSSPFYQNTLQEVVTSATVGTHGLQMVPLAQAMMRDHQKNGSEITQSIPCWMNTSDQLGFIANRSHEQREGTTTGTNESSCNTQGLALSLSSVPPAKSDFSNLTSGSKALTPDLLGNSDSKQSMGSLMGISSFAHRNTGPLGPFTGYATILKNSKYLKPAQELLNDNCNVGGQELVQTCHEAYSQKILEEEMSKVTGDSAASSSTLYGSNEYISGRSSSTSESHRPEFHQKKAKLLYMQEEVCRRYKQYRQQMQMVISSFESVAGLSAATPYVSLALKAVSRHFHFVKNAISEQLTQMRKALGEDLCSPTTGASSSKAFDANTASTSSRLKSMDNSFQRQGKASGGAASFFGPQQPTWRPQRGLPERAVSVLKAWLFDHFLHPYPSDADKHMLATQTGLTRNQVSNWFINARVRIWKPMVEEIHTLETKGLTGSNSNNPPSDGQDASRMDVKSLSDRQQPECSRNSETLAAMDSGDDPNEQQLWDHNKRSREEYQIPSGSMDGSFMSILPYTRAGYQTSGMGPVSLTLGLRQSAEHVQQLQQQEHQLRQHFGGQLIHDFVG